MPCKTQFSPYKVGFSREVFTRTLTWCSLLRSEINSDHSDRQAYIYIYIYIYIYKILHEWSFQMGGGELYEMITDKILFIVWQFYGIESWS